MNDTWQTASYSMTGDTCVEARTAWRKSSYSCGENNCVETRIGAEHGSGEKVVQVRDTKDRDRGIITFGPEAWQAFLLL